MFKIKPTPQELSFLGPEFKKYHDEVFMPFPTRPLFMGGFVNGFLGDPSAVAPGQYLTIATWTGYSKSRGHIHVTNASDLADGYDFDAGFLSHPGDIKTHLLSYKSQREMARRLPYYRGEEPLGHPKFSECSTAALNQDNDGKPVTQNIEYSKEDDEAIEDHIRNLVAVSNATLNFHPSFPK